MHHPHYKVHHHIDTWPGFCFNLSMHTLYLQMAEMHTTEVVGREYTIHSWSALTPLSIGNQCYAIQIYYDMSKWRFFCEIGVHFKVLHGRLPPMYFVLNMYIAQALLFFSNTFGVPEQPAYFYRWLMSESILPSPSTAWTTCPVTVLENQRQGPKDIYWVYSLFICIVFVYGRFFKIRCIIQGIII